ncbi:hypothetical protein X975_02674, partial [Stegodyphus mimosarum]
ATSSPLPDRRPSSISLIYWLTDKFDMIRKRHTRDEIK